MPQEEVDPAYVMHKHFYIHANYSPLGYDMIAKKSIKLTENTRLLLAIFQYEEPYFPQNEHSDEDEDTVHPFSYKVIYSVHAWEVDEHEEFNEFSGYKQLTHHAHVTNSSRHIVSRLILKGELKETYQHYTNYEIEIETVIFEPMGAISHSFIQLA